MSGFEFSEEQIERYSRHILLQEVGGEGQKKLLGSSAFIVGAGGLGSPALLYLAAAGVGKLGVVDADRVEISNLQRQIIHCKEYSPDDSAVRRAARRKRQFPHALPGVRLLLVRENSACFSRGPSFRRPAHEHSSGPGKSLLPLFHPGTSSARDGSELSGGRSARCGGGGNGSGPGGGGPENSAWNRRGYVASISAVRRARMQICHNEASARSRLSALWPQPEPH